MNFLIHHYVDDMAQLHPARLAVTYLEQSMSYAELARRSNQLAHVLIQHGVRRHDRVGIYMDKSINTPVALYGIMKAGAAYVPLDPAAPAARIAMLTNDCDIQCLVSAPAKLRALGKLERTKTPLKVVIGIPERDTGHFKSVPWATLDTAIGAHAPDVKILDSDLAYIIYTSGSTGQPKGIMHTHYSGLSFARWAVGEYQLNPDDRLSNHAPLHFDLSILDYFSAAISGASTCIVPEEYTKLPASYSQLVADQKVTILYTVPFALIQMLLRGALDERDLKCLRYVIYGGEPFPTAHLRALMQKLPHVKFDNMYGPAEINGCSHYTIDKIDSDSATVPIGRIAQCAEFLIVDDKDLCVATGDVGELFVRTPTMMRGYWKRDDLNQRAFYSRVNVIGYTEIFFRTGDLVEELEAGVLRFVGRKDRQVKVRGYRLELDEIELALSAVAHVEEAAVYTLNDSDGATELHAQVTLQEHLDITSREITRVLKKSLPWYAIPGTLHIADKFPRTATGKIDRRALRLRALELLKSRHRPSSVSATMKSGD